MTEAFRQGYMDKIAEFEKEAGGGIWGAIADVITRGRAARTALKKLPATAKKTTVPEILEHLVNSETGRPFMNVERDILTVPTGGRVFDISTYGHSDKELSDAARIVYDRLADSNPPKVAPLRSAMSTAADNPSLVRNPNGTRKVVTHIPGTVGALGDVVPVNTTLADAISEGKILTRPGN